MSSRKHFFQSGSQSLYSNAFIAFSYRDLGIGHTGDHVWVKRTSDNAINQFSFVGGYLDTAGISSWLSGSVGTLRRWYNQGTWGGYFEYETNGNEPIIYNGSAFILDSGLVSIDTATNRTMIVDWSATETFPDDFSAYLVLDIGGNNIRVIQDTAATGTYHLARNFGNILFRHNSTTATFAQTTAAGTRYSAAFHRRLATNEIDLTFNGTDKGTQTMDGTWATARMKIGLSSQNYQEIIYFPTDNSADESAILADQNAFYSIY